MLYDVSAKDVHSAHITRMVIWCDLQRHFHSRWRWLALPDCGMLLFYPSSGKRKAAVSSQTAIQYCKCISRTWLFASGSLLMVSRDISSSASGIGSVGGPVAMARFTVNSLATPAAQIAWCTWCINTSRIDSSNSRDNGSWDDLTTIAFCGCVHKAARPSWGQLLKAILALCEGKEHLHTLLRLWGGLGLSGLARIQ